MKVQLLDSGPIVCKAQGSNSNNQAVRWTFYKPVTIVGMYGRISLSFVPQASASTWILLPGGQPANPNQRILAHSIHRHDPGGVYEDHTLQWFPVDARIKVAAGETIWLGWEYANIYSLMTDGTIHFQVLLYYTED